MQATALTLGHLLWLPLAAGLFLAPGWIWALRWQLPAPALSAFVLSAVGLFNLVLAVDVAGGAIRMVTLAIGMLIFALLGLLYPPRPWTFPALPRPMASARIIPWVVPILLALTSIGLRATIDPLSGYDNGTRWDYLARLFHQHHSLTGYPPVRAADFEAYSWCDGIPPLVPLLNLWIYLITGTTSPAVTALRIVGETLVLGGFIHRYSRLLWGDQASWASLALFASSALAAWSLASGQETGLTAIALVAMLYFLELDARERRRELLMGAALAAAAGALSREYGLAFPLLGLGVLLARRQPSRAGLFVLVSFGAAAPWYLRNAVLTGNPLYPHTFGGLLPGNPVHDEVMRSIAAQWSLERPGAAWYLARLLAVLAGMILMAGIVGAGRIGRRGGAIIVGSLLVLGLWLWSVPQTGGGWVYSTRVLLPLLSLLAVLGGWIAHLPRPFHFGLAGLLSLGAVDAARRSWVLPNLPFAAPLPWTFEAWREIHHGIQEIGTQPIWRALVVAARGREIVVDHTANHALITLQGGRAVPLFSPILSPTFEPDLEFEAALLRLRARGVVLIAITKSNPLFVPESPRWRWWRELVTAYIPAFTTDGLVVFDLYHLRKGDDSVRPEAR